LSTVAILVLLTLATLTLAQSAHKSPAKKELSPAQQLWCPVLDYAEAGAKAGYFPRLDFSEGLTRSNNPVFVFSNLLTQRRFAAPDFVLGSLNFPLPLDNFRTQFAASGL
jgi:hypothetical protein